MNSTVLRATKAMGRESRQTRKERVAVVEAWQNEWGDQRYCSLGRKILRDTSESAKLVATGIGGLINAGFHGQYVCCRGDCRGFWRSESGTVLSSCWRLLTVIEWDCAIVMLNAVDGQRVGLCYRHAEGCWRPESGTVLSSCWRLLTVRVGLCYRQAEVSFCLVPTSIACLFTIQSKFGLSHPQQQNKQTRAERKPQNKKRWTINIEHKTQYSRISWTWRGFVVLLLLLLLFVCCGCCCCLFVVVVVVVCVVVCFLLFLFFAVGLIVSCGVGVGWVGGSTDHPCFSVVKSFNGMLWWLIMEVCKTDALILHASSPNLHGI